jgi:hypothetical protein
MKSQFLFWSIATLLTAVSLASADFNITPEASALLKVQVDVVTAKTPDPQWRASFATALHRYCESVLVQVPRNSPKEDQWVDNELKEASSVPIDPKLTPERWEQEVDLREQRLNRVVTSIEYARQTMRRALSECSSITRDIVERKQKSLAAEALWWVRLSRLYLVRGRNLAHCPANRSPFAKPLQEKSVPYAKYEGEGLLGRASERSRQKPNLFLVRKSLCNSRSRRCSFAGDAIVSVGFAAIRRCSADGEHGREHPCVFCI